MGEDSVVKEASGGLGNGPGFVHLRVHSAYSLLEGALPLKKILGKAVADEQPAIAITDTNNLFVALEFSQKALGDGIQPIIGCQLDVTYVQPEPGKRAEPPAPVVLLAQSEQGWMNLMKLNSCAYLDAQGQLPQVTVDELAEYSDGLICLSGGPDGPIGRLLRAGQPAKAQALLARLAEIYPNRLYVELQRHPGENGQPEAERLTERGHVEMAYAMDLPLVATNDAHFGSAAVVHVV